MTPLAERPWEDIERMLDVDTALERILAMFKPLPTERVALLEGRGRYLSSDVSAMDNVPPFRNSAMDGYAVRCADLVHASWQEPVSLVVEGHVAAGAPEAPRLQPGAAIRIMTGAPLPRGADAVVRFEETDEAASAGDIDRKSVQVFRPPAALDNVREAGEDIQAGAVIARPGQRLGPAILGLLASVGRASVEVHRRPLVAILSTGNEVVMPHLDLPKGKIRDSNAYVLGSLAESWGANVRLLGVARDTVEDLTGHLDEARDADLIVTSGGVSLGDFDFVKDVLRAEGQISIWQVRMKPGKPLAFGILGNIPLLGVPGNPVAAAVSFLLFGRPAIRRMLGDPIVAPPSIQAIVGEPIDNRGQRRHFLRVRLAQEVIGPPIARAVGEQGAGVLSSLAAADALLVVPESLEMVPAGTLLQAILLER